MIIDTVYNEDGEFVREEPFDTDVELDKLYPTELTNEEYLRSCTTEQLADLITDIVYECKEQDDCMDCKLGWCSTKNVVEWLKQPHTFE